MANNFSLNDYLTIDTTGSIGIGTTNPSAKFQVTGSNTVTNQSTAIFKAGTSSQTGGVGILDVQNSAGTSLLFVSGSGNVGIGTASPSSLGTNYTTLDIRGSAGGGIRMGTPSIMSYMYADSSGWNVSTSTALPIIFYTNNSERVRIDSSGNVGIGTATYTARLFVSGSTTASTPTMIVREGVVSPTAGAGVLDVQNSTGTSILFVSGSGNIGVGTNTPIIALDVYSANPQLRLRGTGTTTETRVIASFGGAALAAIGTVDSNPLMLMTSNTERMRFDTSGNIGIGTSTYTARLFVSGSSTASTPTMIVREGVVSPAGGALAFEVENSAGTTILAVSGSGNVGIGTATPTAKLHAVGSSGGSIFTLQSTDSTYARMYLLNTNRNWSVTANGTTLGPTGGFVIADETAGAFRLVIDSAGNVGVGSTATISSRLQVSGSSTASTPTMVVREGVVSPTGGVGLFDVQNSAGTSILFVTGSGRVGIGTITPQATFHVSNGTSPNLAQIYIGFAGSSNYYDANNHYFRDGSANSKARLDSSGNFTPATDNAQDLGSTALRWRNVYATSVSGSLTGSNVLAGQVVVAGTGGVLSGSNNLWWDNTNTRVGIGTTSPSAKLHVEGNLFLGATSRVIYQSGAANLQLQTGTGAILFARADGVSESARIDSSGNVGIGTNGPVARLHVSGSATASTPTMVVKGGAPNATGALLDVQNNNATTQLVVSSSGNVGVGTNNPSGKFEVVGTSGSLLLITDSLSGSLFSVNDVSGLPILEVFSDDRVVAGAVNSNALVVTGSLVGVGTNSPTARLFVSGSSIANQPDVIIREGVVSPTGGAGILDVQNSAGTSLLFVSGSGWVGLGTTTNPNGYRQINVGDVALFTTNDSAGNTNLRLNSSTSMPQGVAVIGSTKDAVGGGNLTLSTATGGTVTERMRIDSSGFLYVGGISTQLTNEVVRIGRASTQNSILLNNSAADNATIVGSFNDAASLGVNRNPSTGGFVSTSKYAAELYAVGTTSTSYVAFATANAANTGPTERMRIDSTGNVGIGTTTTSSKVFVYTAQNDASTTPTFDVNGAYMRIGDYTTGLTFTNGVGLKIHDGNVVHYSVGQIGGKLFISDTSSDGNALFPVSRGDIASFSNTLIAFSGSVQPGTDNTYDMGSTTKRWRNVYATSISGSLTGSNVSAGQVVVAGTGGVLSGSNNFFWDNTNGRVGIGTASPANLLTISKGNASGFNLQYDAAGNARTGLFLATRGSSSAIIGGGSEWADATTTARSTAAEAIVQSAGVIQFFTDTGLTSGNTFTPTERVRIDSSGNVGIGTTSPATKLAVYGGAVSANYGVFSGSLAAFASSTGALYTYYSGTTAIISANSDNSGNAADLDIFIGATRAMRLNTSQNVGIGTVTYTARLHVSGSSTGTSTTLLARHGVANGSNLPVLDVQNSAGTSLLFVSGSGAVGIGTNTSLTQTLNINGGTQVQSTNYVYFFDTNYSIRASNGLEITTKTGDVTRFLVGSTEVARVDASGNVGIGTASIDKRLFVYGPSNTSALTVLHVQSGSLGTGLNAGSAYNGGDMATFQYSNGNTSYLKIKGVRHTAGSNDWTTASTRIQQVIDLTNMAYIDFNPAGGTYGFAIGTGSGPTEALRIDSSQKVGIGTTSPNAVLDVSKSSGAVDIRLSNGGTAYMNLYAGSGVGALTLLAVQSEPLVLGTANAEKMRIDSSGNVGINTASMSRKLVVHGSDALINSHTVGRGSASADSTNSALGSFANSTVTSGQYNTAVGYYANRQSNGGENTAVGYVAMDGNTASYNTAVGSQALYAVTSGPYNTAVGYKSLYSAGASNYSVGVGAEAGYGGSSAGRTAIGYQALAAAAAAYTTAVGYRSLNANTTGVNNVGLGAYTLEVNDTGDNNTAVGANALLKLLKYHRNTAVGADSMANSTQGQDSVAVGYKTLYSTSTDVANVAVGSYSLQTVAGGSYNVGIGYSSLYSVSTGGFNVAVGPQAGTSITSGGGNVVIGGYGAGGSFATQSNNIFIADGNATLRMMITSSNGGVGIGTTSWPGGVSAGTTTLHTYRSAGNSLVAQSATNASELDLIGRGTSDITGSVIVTGGTGVTPEMQLGSITSHALAFFTNNSRAMTVDTSQRVGVGTNSPDTTANTKFHVYNGNAIFNNTYGINWSGLSGPTNGTRTASTLDHYDYGTWTPVFAGSSSAGTYTLTNTKAYYVRVGKLVVVSMYTEVSGIPSAGIGDWRINGLPYSSSSGIGIASVGKYSGLATSVATISGVVEEGNTYVEMYVTTANAAANTKAAIGTYVGTSTKIAMTITYRVT